MTFWSDVFGQLSWARQMFGSAPPADESYRPLAERILTEHYGTSLEEAIARWDAERTAREARRNERIALAESLIRVEDRPDGTAVVKFSFYSSAPMPRGKAVADAGYLRLLFINTDGATPHETLAIAVRQFLDRPEVRLGSYTPDGQTFLGGGSNGGIRVVQE